MSEVASLPAYRWGRNFWEFDTKFCLELRPSLSIFGLFLFLPGVVNKVAEEVGDLYAKIVYRLGDRDLNKFACENCAVCICLLHSGDYVNTCPLQLWKSAVQTKSSKTAKHLVQVPTAQQKICPRAKSRLALDVLN